MTERTERLVLPNEILQRRERRKIRAANAARSFVVFIFQTDQTENGLRGRPFPVRAQDLIFLQSQAQDPPGFGTAAGVLPGAPA